MIVGCKGDMQIQEIFDVNVFNHSSFLCTSDKEEFKSRMTPGQLKNLTKDIDDNSYCNVAEFFDKQKFIQDLESCKNSNDMAQRKTCNFNKKVKSYFKEGHDCYKDIGKLDLTVQVKCGNPPDVIAARNKSGVICSSLGLLCNLLFIIGISYNLNRMNKIRKLKFAEYTVSSKNFTCELTFDDDLFDYLLYKDKDEDDEDKELDDDAKW